MEHGILGAGGGAGAGSGMGRRGGGSGRRRGGKGCIEFADAVAEVGDGHGSKL